MYPDWYIHDGIGAHFMAYCPVRPFRRVLQQLDRLAHLTIASPSHILDLILDDLAVPFRLHTFIHTHVQLSTPLLRFLEQQPSIVRLGWHGWISVSDARDLGHSIQENPGLLPKLEALEGSIRALGALTPRRPVSNITILHRPVSFLPEIPQALSHTLVPTTCLCVVDFDMEARWINTIVKLRQKCALDGLKVLRVVITTKPDVEDDMVRNNGRVWDHLPEDLPFDFLRFNALEKFEVTLDRSENHEPLSWGIHEWLAFHKMDCLPSWRAFNPSLRTVVLWGHVIP
ncbi:hypothetical protein B0J17DRAFT_243416 [Rhizoctonia solani]|nr:hypothetical protein B0J17DRAFT_243416 [Rhizoctonia solani]